MKNKINNVSIDVQFNGKPTKQYSKDGNLFIEAREDSEYELFVRNDNPFRIIAIIGVDGLNVINGKINSHDSPGYIINKYDTLKVKGFRISDNEVATFKFCRNGESYASSKEINAQNGIISLVCYKEYEKPQPIVIEEPVIIKKKKIIIEEEPYDPWPYKPYYPKPIWTTTFKCSNLESRSALNQQNVSMSDNQNFSCQFLNSVSSDSANNFSEKPSHHFDMGTKFGQAKDNKVIKVEFIKGKLLGEISIFYASKKSLIDMGVNIFNESQITFPKGIQEYCSIPQGWNK